MLRNIILSLSVPAVLSACGGGQDDYPRLLPTQAILAEPTLPDHAAPAATGAEPVKGGVEARGAATQARADAIPDPVDERDLAARAADLRRRAEALRNSTETATPCPPGADPAECPAPTSTPPAE